jgi:acyl-CoA:acyl-CoA alkyltransferase
LIQTAFNQALARADVDPDSLDLVIYAGVDRGFLEPANAYLVAQALGLEDVECFDVLDACNGWSRAIRIAHAHLSTGDYHRIAIINSEFNMFDGGTIFPRLFELANEEEIDWCFPAYTLGEGATVSIVSNHGGGHWEFLSKSRNELADLCTVPVYEHGRYCLPSSRIARKGPGSFASFGHELFAEAAREAVALFSQMRTPTAEIRIVIPHAATKTTWDDLAREVGVEGRLYHIYPQCGNLVSASVPAGIALAVDDGKITRGDRVVAWVASAGMSFSICSFVY